MNNWHDQVTSLTLRLYSKGTSYENKDQYCCVVQAELFTDDSAYLHAALKADGVEISYKEWMTLFMILYHKYGVKCVQFDRGQREAVVNIERLLARNKDKE